MWSYYELTTAQTQADRRASAGYSVSPAAAREFPEDAIARALNEQHESVKIQEQAARQIAIGELYRAIEYGSALLKHSLASCDKDQKLAYLESTNPANVSLYRRYGFEVIGNIQAGNSPPMFQMIREPQ